MFVSDYRITQFISVHFLHTFRPMLRFGEDIVNTLRSLRSLRFRWLVWAVFIAVFFALQRYLLETSPPDGPLQWLGPVRTGFAPSEFVISRVMEAVVLLPWLGSLVFFFAVRRQRARQPDDG